MGHPLLLQRAAPIVPDRALMLLELVSDMIDVLRKAGGVGLAAPQVGEGVRVIIFLNPEERASGLPDDQPMPLQVLVNPEIEPIGSDMVSAWEGCLSLPGLIGDVPRHARIKYGAFDGEGNRIERQASGFHARVIQHEVDHLDGILYPQRMTDLRRLAFAEEFHRHGLDGPALSDG